MKFIYLAVLINCLALGAMAQGTDNQSPSDDAADKLSRSRTLKTCQLACEATQRDERSTCRQQGSTCFSQALDVTLEKYAERSASCTSGDTNARNSCRLAALGWAISQTADERQVCTSTRTICLNDADDRATTCTGACSDMYPDPTDP